jgi:hypothetical protein
VGAFREAPAEVRVPLVGDRARLLYEVAYAGVAINQQMASLRPLGESWQIRIAWMRHEGPTVAPRGILAILVDGRWHATGLARNLVDEQARVVNNAVADGGCCARQPHHFAGAAV